jgi:LmbE family N-acetylglucosaminyl deacetylase
MSNRILVIAAHPDDEILGAGATLIKHTKEKDKVFCLILSQGVLSRTNAKINDVSKLMSESKKAGKVMGFKEIYFADLPDNSFDTVSLLKVVKIIETYLAKVKPDIIYTHFDNDLNIDHRITSQAVITASRPCNPNHPKEILAFETLSSTEWQAKKNKQFCPNVYVDIEKCIGKKIEAMKKYDSELRTYPHSRSIEGIKILAKCRGLEAGLKFAEAFYLIRKIG